MTEEERTERTEKVIDWTVFLVTLVIAVGVVIAILASRGPSVKEEMNLYFDCVKRVTHEVDTQKLERDAEIYLVEQLTERCFHIVRY